MKKLVSALILSLGLIIMLLGAKCSGNEETSQLKSTPEASPKAQVKASLDFNEPEPVAKPSPPLPVVVEDLKEDVAAEEKLEQILNRETKLLEVADLNGVSCTEHDCTIELEKKTDDVDDALIQMPLLELLKKTYGDFEMNSFQDEQNQRLTVFIIKR